MRSSNAKLDQALKDLVEAYMKLEEESSEKYGEDEEAIASNMLEELETAVESAIEEHDSSTGAFATILSSLSEALEQLDPSAFDDESEEGDDDESDYDIDELDDEEIDYDDLDEEDDDDDDDE